MPQSIIALLRAILIVDNLEAVDIAACPDIETRFLCTDHLGNLVEKSFTAV